MSTFPIVRYLTAFIGLSVAVSLGAQPAPQREPQEPRQPPIRTQANYVRVDAYPTQNGEPVLGLRAEDFQVFEDGAPQAITAFEHVLITSAGPQSQRKEPNTVEASRQAAMNPRSRVFVIFLDAPHTTIEGTWHIREPLIRLIDRILGPDDLVGILTPEMAPHDMTLARKTEVIEKGLREAWPWGYRHTLQQDRREYDYDLCYPETLYGDLAKQLIPRRRERISLEALNDLVYYLRDLREERKAILTVSEGWLLYRPEPDLMRLRKALGWEEPIPGTDPIGVGPGGKITLGKPNDATGGLTKTSCDTDRMRLAQADNYQYFLDLVQNANRANASFYTVDPRGLAAWDTPLGPAPPLPMLVDQAHLKTRLEAIRTLATGTDGMWVTSSNDLHQSLKRIADDLTSYYLLGYYSTNAKLDGRFRKLDVRVKRPGVNVRARRGYRAPTEAEVMSARAAAAPAEAPPEAKAVTSAMDALARIRPEARFRIHAAPGGDPAGGVTRVWIAGEIQPPPASDPWARGGSGDIEVSAGGTTASARVTIAPGERAFLTSVTLPKAATGALEVRARLTGSQPDAARLADSIHVPLTAGTQQPLLFRRGPTTGNKLQPAATFLFSRTERLHIEIPVAAGTSPGAGQLLDRTGKPLPVPVTVGQKTDESGGVWITADVTLAPLGAGDYAVEVTSKSGTTEQKTVAAVRVVR